MGNFEKQALVLSVQECLYAIPLDLVQRVVPAAEITPIPDSSTTISGLINLSGDLIPVLDMRQLLLQTHQDVQLSDQFIIIQIKERKVALWADFVVGIVETVDTDFISIDTLATTTTKRISDKAMKLNEKIVYLIDVVRYLEEVFQ